MNSEQLPAVSGDIHGKDYVRQAVHGFMSPSVVTHVISADGYVIVPAPRLILSLLISPDVSDFSLSNQ